jgi:hypothetical protein
MCDVAFISMASTVAQTAGQAQTYRANVNAANTAYVDQVTGIGERQHQMDQAAVDQMTQRSRQGMEEVAAVQAIFADSGMSGNSQDRVVADAQRASSRDLTTMERNRDLVRQQSSSEVAAAGATRTSRINSVAHPNFIGAGLQIAGSYVDYQSRQSKPSPSK